MPVPLPQSVAVALPVHDASAMADDSGGGGAEALLDDLEALFASEAPVLIPPI